MNCSVNLASVYWRLNGIVEAKWHFHCNCSSSSNSMCDFRVRRKWTNIGSDTNSFYLFCHWIRGICCCCFSTIFFLSLYIFMKENLSKKENSRVRTRLDIDSSKNSYFYLLWDIERGWWLFCCSLAVISIRRSLIWVFSLHLSWTRRSLLCPPKGAKQFVQNPWE